MTRLTSMPVDYSRFDNIEDSDDDTDEVDQKSARENRVEEETILSNLPSELSRDLSLILAAQQGQFHVLQALVDSRASVNGIDPHGKTALHHAVSGGVGSRSTIEFLLKHRAQVDVESDEGITPLGIAASVGPAELCETLLEAEAPGERVCGLALGAAAVAGNRETTRVLLRTCVCPAEPTSYDGRAALHCWATHGDVEMVQQLVGAHASINARNGKGMTALMCAVCAGSLSMAEWLCEHGCMVNSAANDGRVALVNAAESRSEQSTAITEVLLKHRASPDVDLSMHAPSPLVAAACTGHRSITTMLIEARASAHASDAMGRQPLPCAALTGDVELCRLLLNGSACVHDRTTNPVATKSSSADGTGATAMSIATVRRDANLFRLLLDARADVDAVDERGCTPLIASARDGILNLCNELIAARADVNSLKHSSGKSALMLAASNGHVVICKALLAARASIEVHARTGVTALHAAAGNGHEEVCKVLLAAGATLDTLGPGGQDASAIAAAGGHISLSKLLLTQ